MTEHLPKSTRPTAPFLEHITLPTNTPKVVFLTIRNSDQLKSKMNLWIKFTYFKRCIFTILKWCKCLCFCVWICVLECRGLPRRTEASDHPGAGLPVVLSCLTWMVAAEPGSFARAAWALGHCGIFQPLDTNKRENKSEILATIATVGWRVERCNSLFSVSLITVIRNSAKVWPRNFINGKLF